MIRCRLANSNVQWAILITDTRGQWLVASGVGALGRSVPVPMNAPGATLSALPIRP